jgi:hypothetical protein
MRDALARARDSWRRVRQEAWLRPWREPLAAFAVFVVLIVIMMWPQVRHITDRAIPHQDVYFNMWRLRWFAHALVTSPTRLFDGNIFYPEPRTLTLSDAMIVEGIVAAPLVWLDIRPVLVHNLMMLLPIAVSSLGLFMLVRHLTGSRGAALLAGVIFAFVPYRYEHIMHMELQWTMWMPWAFLALHRTLETGRLRDGLATGLAVTLQMLSSIYYGIFLATLLGVSAVLMLIGDRGVSLRRALVPLAVGAVLTAVVCGLYAVPYLQTRESLGERPDAEVTRYSAEPASYLVATPSNLLYGNVFTRGGGPERRLFPGGTALLLAMIGLLLIVPTRRQIVYVIALLLAFEMSLGFGGYTYSFLHSHVSAYRSLRAPARLGIFVVMFLGILAAYGYVAIASSLRPSHRRVLLAVLLVMMLVEYRPRMRLVEYPNSAPPIYRLLARQAPGVVAEFPVPRAFPGREAEYAYMSTFHWKPLLNGYSGHYPKSYLQRLARLRSFPQPTAIAQLRRAGVRYVIVHAFGSGQKEFDGLRQEIATSGDLLEIGVFDDNEGPAVLYELK